MSIEIQFLLLTIIGLGTVVLAVGLIMVIGTMAAEMRRRGDALIAKSMQELDESDLRIAEIQSEKSASQRMNELLEDDPTLADYA